MALEGKQLGRYHILRLLGSGGMGDVYLAEDPRIRQQVAVKVIRAELTPYPNAQGTQEAARLFQREARAIGQLDHSHILPLYDYGESQLGEQTLIYLVMPYRPEGSLVTWVRQHYPDRLVPPDVVAHLVSQAAGALQHAHSRQIIHQDVKPSNFLMRANPTTPMYPDLLLADFGIARIATSTSSTSQSMRGTPLYIAPEQSMSHAVPASDQYALAVMAYELLAGRPPFQGNTVQLIFQHLQTSPPPASSFNPRLPQALDEVLLIGLSKRPEERFASITAFANAFRNAVQQAGLADASTRLSGEPLPRITAVLPAISLSGAELGDAITQFTPGGDPLGDAPTRVTPFLPEDALALTTPAPPGPSAPLTPAWSGSPTTLETAAEPETLDSGAGEAGDPARLVGGTGRSGPVADTVMPPPAPTIITRRRGGKRRWLLIAAALVALMLVLGGVAYAVPGGVSTLFGPSAATVTITPTSKDLSNTYSLSAVTGTPDASKQQVGAHTLSATEGPYTQTVNATGQGTIPGNSATGYVIIVNSYASAAFFGAGTSFYNNFGSGPGVSFVINASVTIDYGSPAVVYGYVQEVGSIGNMSAGNFYSCYSGGCPNVPSIYVQGYSDFTGGTDPQTYTAVAQSDINNAASALESANKPNPQQVFQSQIQPYEQFVGTPQCTPSVSSDHNAGDQATQVTVNVSFACTAEVYDHTAALAMAENLLETQAETDPGAAYALVGTIKTAITSVTAGNQNTVTITTTAEGVWVYQFSAARKRALAQMIAGKSKTQAQQLLSTQDGVARAIIQVSGGDGQTLPSDAAKITLVVQPSTG